MTISKGRPWGETAVLDEGATIVHSDREAAATLAAARLEGRPLPTIGLLGGDLCRTLGGRGDERGLYAPTARRYPIDLGLAELDGVPHVFVAHVIARRAWWRGRAVAVMNAQWLGTWDLGPRSHPNDGLLDVSDGTMPLGDRLKARRRLATGTHIPHPGIATSRVRRLEVSFASPLPVMVDGVAVGSGRELRVEVVADAFHVVISAIA